MASGRGNSFTASVQYTGVRMQTNTQYARSGTIAVGGTNPNGNTQYEMQALCKIDSTHASQQRIFMMQFPAGRQAGLFVSNLYPTPDLVTGDSQAGSVGGVIDGGNSGNGKWCLYTFSSDGTPATSGLYRGSIQPLDASFGFQAGGRAKGVENSLQAERFDLNGGGVDFGFADITIAEIRIYNAQRSDAQRQIDLTNSNPAGAYAWWRITDSGGGVPVATDISGNGRALTFFGSPTAVTGPLF